MEVTRTTRYILIALVPLMVGLGCATGDAVQLPPPVPEDGKLVGESNPNGSQTGASGSGPDSPVPMSITGLYEEYEANPYRFHEERLGLWLRITGTVAKVNQRSVELEESCRPTGNTILPPFCKPILFGALHAGGTPTEERNFILTATVGTRLTAICLLASSTGNLGSYELIDCRLSA